MEIRRLFTFFILSAAILFLWNRLVIQPQMQAPPPDAPKDTARPNPPADPSQPAIAEKPFRLQQNPHREDLTIGSLDPDSGYFFRATLTTTGGAVRFIELNDPRYHNLDEPEEPLKVVQSVIVDDEVYRTFATELPELDELLQRRGGITLDEADWQMVQSDAGSVTFAFTVPGRVEIRKRYLVPKIDPQKVGVPLDKARDQVAAGYKLQLDVTIKNLAAAKQDVRYRLLGPVGLPVENADTARKLRDVKYGYFDEDRELQNFTLTPDELIDAERNRQSSMLRVKEPFQYMGVDGQFFAALLLPAGDPPSTTAIEYAQGLVIHEVADDTRRSEMSVAVVSDEFALKPGAQLTHSWALYAGPKRQELLDQIDAGAIVEYGWFGWISKGMLWLLNFLHHSVHLPYALAIVCLTVIVRGALFPISRKQALSAARMKELQPKLQELKKKYGDDKEKFVRAQMELFRQAGYNPLAGCLPMLLQLPIFIGLYYGLYTAVDLRAAEFLWIENLAAPDQLFPFPFEIPYLGAYFNLLPILTIVLFIIQQKLFMPAPTPGDEQAQMQHRIMNIMMVVMGFLFYHVPAGLCIYFIASSLWGVGERKLLDLTKQAQAPGDSGGGGGGGGGAKPFGGKPSSPRALTNGGSRRGKNKKKSKSRR